MPAFAYRAVNARGKTFTGSAEAPTAPSLARSLEERGLVVVELAETSAVTGLDAHGRVSTRELAEVTRALAALLPAGLPLAKALAAASNVARGRLAVALDQARERVEHGDALATALTTLPGVFPPMYVGLIRAGERSGTLDETFDRLATQLERDAELRAKLVSAAIYPTLLAIVGGVAVLVLMLLVIPRFGDLLQESGAELPRSTAVVLALSSSLRSHWTWLFVSFATVALAAYWTRSSPRATSVVARYMLRVPILGTIRRELLTARFAQLTSVLIGGGAPLLAALDDVAKSMSDGAGRDEIWRLRTRVREGAALYQAISEGVLFPPLLAQLVSIGEQAGRLEEFLGKAAELFERRTERTTARLVALAEPAMIIAFGVVVGFVALSLLQAIYGVNAGSFR